LGQKIVSAPAALRKDAICAYVSIPLVLPKGSRTGYPIFCSLRRFCGSTTAVQTSNWQCLGSTSLCSLLPPWSLC